MGSYRSCPIHFYFSICNLCSSDRCLYLSGQDRETERCHCESERLALSDCLLRPEYFGIGLLFKLAWHFNWPRDEHDFWLCHVCAHSDDQAIAREHFEDVLYRQHL